jgi:tetratricopeptide (TPR) repeat protein
MRLPWLDVQKHNTTIFAVLLVTGMLFLMLPTTLVSKTIQNGADILALHAITNTERRHEIERLPEIACQQTNAYDSAMRTPQMARQVTDGNCFVLGGRTSSAALSTIPSEHRYWLAISATAVDPGADEEKELWQSLNLPVEYFAKPGMQALTQNQLIAAYYWCRLALVAHPGSGQAAYCYGRVAQSDSRHADAVAFYRQAVNGEPDLLVYEQFQLYSRLGQLLLDQFDRADEARPWLEQAAVMPVNCCAPQRALTHNRLGRIFEAENNYAEANAHHQQAITLEPGNPWFLRDAGRAAYRANADWSLARPYLIDALTVAGSGRVVGDNVILWLSAAQLFLNAQAYDDLLPLLANAPDHVQINPDFARLYARTAALAGSPQLCRATLADAAEQNWNQNELEQLQQSICSDE